MRNSSLHGRAVVHTLTLPEGIRFPHDVIGHPDLTVDEQRAILSAWASDASAVPDMPTLRELAGTPFPVTYSSIQEARDRLDRLDGVPVAAMKRHRGFGSPSDPQP